MAAIYSYENIDNWSKPSWIPGRLFLYAENFPIYFCERRFSLVPAKDREPAAIKTGNIFKKGNGKEV